MTQKPEHDDHALEAFFAAERDARTPPSDAFLARVEVDALNAQNALEQKTAPKPRGMSFQFLNWGAFAGLAACLVLGVGLGGGFSGQIGAYGDYYLSGGLLASEGLFPTGLDTSLMGEEG